MSNHNLKGKRKLEREVIGHALVYTHYLDYLGPRENTLTSKQLKNLLNATDKLRDFYKRHNIPIDEV